MPHRKQFSEPIFYKHIIELMSTSFTAILNMFNATGGVCDALMQTHAAKNLHITYSYIMKHLGNKSLHTNSFL